MAPDGTAKSIYSDGDYSDGICLGKWSVRGSSIFYGVQICYESDAGKTVVASRLPGVTYVVYLQPDGSAVLSMGKEG